MFILDGDLLKRLTDRKVSLAEIETQEKKCFLSKFDAEIAFELGTFIRAATKELFPGNPVAIDITLSNGHCLFRTMINSGTGIENDFWIARKQKTVFRFDHSTFYMGCKKADKTPEERFFVDSKEYAFHGGSVPIYLLSTDFPVACLTISGLKQEEDHLLAVTSIVEFANRATEAELSLD